MVARIMHQHGQLADLVDVLALDFDIVDRLGDKTRPEALGERLEGKPKPKDSVSQQSLSPWPSSASGTHSWRSTDHTGWMVVPVMVSTAPSAPSTSTLATPKWLGLARLRVDLEAVGILSWIPRSNRHRFDGDLKLRARCYRCVTLGCEPWRFLGWLIEPAWVRPK